MNIIVLDINGVIAEVRKPHDSKSGADLVLPNGQPVFYRSDCKEYIESLCAKCDLVVIYTNRMRKNAMPIIIDMIQNRGLPNRIPIMTGEDCLQMCEDEPWRPKKSAEAVILKLRRLIGITNPSRGIRSIEFIDDNPQRIDLDSMHMYPSIRITANLPDGHPINFRHTDAQK